MPRVYLGRYLWTVSDRDRQLGPAGPSPDDLGDFVTSMLRNRVRGVITAVCVRFQTIDVRVILPQIRQHEYRYIVFMPKRSLGPFVIRYTHY